MKTVILCGGLGTRLREETEFKPKPMVKIGSHPIIWHIMHIYAHQGFKDFVLALGYKGEMIKDYFCHYELMNNDVMLTLGKPDCFKLHNPSHCLDWRITLADTGDTALKGARLKTLEKYLEGDTFMLTYGDGLADVDLNRLLEFHKSHGKIATVTGVNLASRFGELKIEGAQVLNFREKPDENVCSFINGGYFVFNRELLDRLSDDPQCDLEYGPLEDLARDGELMVYKHTGFWACMDTIRDRDYLNNLWHEGCAAWKIW